MINFLLVIPGYGGKEYDKKSDFINQSINKIKQTAPTNSIFTIKIFNYDSSPNNFKFGEFEEIIKPGILGEYIYNYIQPEMVEKYDYVIMMLDDIILQDNFNLNDALTILNLYNLDLISPSLTLDSVHTHKESLVDSTEKSVVPELEYAILLNFFYILCLLNLIINILNFFTKIQNGCGVLIIVWII